MKGQFGVEYLVIAGILLMLLAPVTIYTVENVRMGTQTIQAQSAADIIANTVDFVGYQGYPARKTIDVLFPENAIAGSYITNNTVVIKLDQPGGTDEAVATHDQCASGNLPGKGGLYKIIIYAEQSGCIGTSIDLIVITPSSVYLEDEPFFNTSVAFSLVNYGDSMTMTLTATGGTVSYIDVDPDTSGVQSTVQFDLGKSLAKMISVSAPASGTHQGYLTFTSGEYSKQVPVTIKVKPKPSQLLVSTFSDAAHTQPENKFAKDELVYVQVDCDSSTGVFGTILYGPSNFEQNLGNRTCPQTSYVINTTTHSLGTYLINATSGSVYGTASYKLLKKAVHHIDTGSSVYSRNDTIFFSIYDQKGTGVNLANYCPVECDEGDPFNCREICHQTRHGCEQNCGLNQTCYDGCVSDEDSCKGYCIEPKLCEEDCHNDRHDCEFVCKNSYQVCMDVCGGSWECMDSCLVTKNECFYECAEDEYSCRGVCGNYYECKFECHDQVHSCTQDCYDTFHGVICIDCETCERIFSLTIRHNDTEPGNIVSSYATHGSHHDFIKDYVMTDEGVFVATDVHPSIEGASEITFEVGSDEGVFHTSCSQPIGPGSESGNFKIIDWDPECRGGHRCRCRHHGGDEECDCHECGICNHIDALTLRYTGWEPYNYVEVYDHHDALIGNYTLDGDSEFTVLDVPVPKITPVIGEYYREIHVSCSQPIGVGMRFGYFIVTDIEADDYDPECLPEGDCSSIINVCVDDCEDEEADCAHLCTCLPDCLNVEARDKNLTLNYGLLGGVELKDGINGEIVGLGNGTYYLNYIDVDEEFTDADIFIVNVLDPWIQSMNVNQSKVFEIYPGTTSTIAHYLQIEEPDFPNVPYDEDLTVKVWIKDKNNSPVTSSTPAIEIVDEFGEVVDSGSMSLQTDNSFEYDVSSTNIEADTTYHVRVIYDETASGYQNLFIVGSRSFNGVMS